jgi:hypothetical protein
MHLGSYLILVLIGYVVVIWKSNFQFVNITCTRL